MTRAIVRHDIETASGAHRVEQRVDLDEVVIPGRVHVEDMGGGVWSVILGTGAESMTLSVGPRGVIVVEDLRAAAKKAEA